MTIEDKLKDYILTRYKSVREFSQVANLPNSTVKSVLSRGVNNSSLSVVIKICNTLHLSADALANGEIKAREDIYTKPITDVKIILDDTKNKLKHTNHLTIDGNEVDIEIIDPLLESLEIGYEMSKRKSEKIASKP